MMSGQHSSSSAFHQLNTIRDKLALSDTLAQERGLIRSRTVDGTMTAAVYIACRETCTPKSLEDISIVSNLKRKDITRCYRRLLFDLDIKIPKVDPMKCIVSCDLNTYFHCIFYIGGKFYCSFNNLALVCCRISYIL